METFFKVITPDEVFRIIDRFEPLGDEPVSIEKALGRILSQEILSPENLPGFYRSSMDGYALKAKDTFGASESLPALIEVCGEVAMGERPDFVVGQGRGARISTGGMLPEGADGVVMVEYCHLIDDRTLEISKAISPLENVIQPHDDFKENDIVLKKGQKLRPQDLGVLAGLGLTSFHVYKRPKVAILSTGDEIVPIDRSPRPGQVRDINRYSLGAFCQQVGGDSEYFGPNPDDFDALKSAIEKALERSDMVWISGGSSVGTRDLTLKVFETIPGFDLLVHGISISPGKPTIIGRAGKKPIIGLPGHVVSALIIAEVFLKRLIFRIAGRLPASNAFKERLEAEMARNVESKSGREDYVRVKLYNDGARLIAEPIFGKSALISTLVEADGLIRIDMNTEGLYKGQAVEVMMV